MNRQIKKAIIFGIAGLAVLFYFLNPGDSEIFPRCIFMSLTGYYCPGCGSQSAFHSFLHLNMAGVASNNFLFLPALTTIGYHYVHPFLNSKFHLHLPNVFYLKSTPWIVLIIVLLFWILRNLPYLPFSKLAPL